MYFLKMHLTTFQTDIRLHSLREKCIVILQLALGDIGFQCSVSSIWSLSFHMKIIFITVFVGSFTDLSQELSFNIATVKLAICQKPLKFSPNAINKFYINKRLFNCVGKLGIISSCDVPYGFS